MKSENHQVKWEKIRDAKISNWEDINQQLTEISQSSALEKPSIEEIHDITRKGVAFITYDFGIDGVSIEIAKYAQCLENMFSTPESPIPLHVIAGDFYEKADAVLKPYWKRHEIDGINGWSKWYDGVWFTKLFYEEMPENSAVSNEVAQEMWSQAVNFAENLGNYLTENQVQVLIPVNIPTNPGNVAAMLAIVMVTEVFDINVISSNHDFYWEGGKPASEKAPGEDAGPRDHFFRNIDNKPFFDLFRRLYPWNGKRWLQVNINTPQSEALVKEFGFSKEKVFELGTSISDAFFVKFDFEDQRLARKKMAHILGDGNPVIPANDIHHHLANLADWMGNQHPILCGSRAGLTCDPTTDKTIYCLQPTRVIARKRIEKDLHLLNALFKRSKFSTEFTEDSDYQLVLHITGPVPIEHQEDLETILKAYVDLVDSLPSELAERVFIAFSVGTENHPSLEPNGMTPLCIEEIYRLATAIVFPSETEGRGLPIIESSAGGVPIICSRYYPERVFAEVVGEDLEEEEQIQYFLFPEDDFSTEFLAQVSDLLLHPENFDKLKKHNKEAVRLRYSMEMIRKKFELFLQVMAK